MAPRPGSDVTIVCAGHHLGGRHEVGSFLQLRRLQAFKERRCWRTRRRARRLHEDVHEGLRTLRQGDRAAAAAENVRPY